MQIKQMNGRQLSICQFSVRNVRNVGASSLADFDNCLADRQYLELVGSRHLLKLVKRRR